MTTEINNSYPKDIVLSRGCYQCYCNQWTRWSL